MTTRLPLGDVADVRSGTSIDRKRRTDTGVPVYGLDQVAGRPSDLPPCAPEHALPSRTTRLRAGDVVLALVGRAGRSAVVGPEHEGAALDRECAVIRLHDTDGPVSSEWLQLWIRSSDCRDQMEAQTTGSTIPRVPAHAVRELQLPVTAREDQLRAHEGVERLDAAVNATRRTLAVLEQLRIAEVDLRVYDAAREDE